MTRSSLALDRSVLRLDIVGSSAGGRDRQVYLDRALRAVVDRAIEHSAAYPVAESSYLRVDGDSATLLVGAAVAKAWLLADFVLRETAIALGEVNKPVNEDHRLRVRMALDHGETVVNPPNIGGRAVATTARLIDAPAFRQAVAAAPGQDFGLIVSDRFHSDVVVDGERGLGRLEFRPIEVEVKDFRQTGWVYVPADEVPRRDAVPRSGAVPHGPAPSPAKLADTILQFNAAVHAQNSVFGLSRSDDRD
ncbi:hypothetical protein [Saccharothrix deserti]|uniref:hypothetical protein n=1 Tax=Saccharothrix deserti TaxID=2593674 RepID=UPI00131D7183|nr:hypothetical protein [Saccharothrix deserti]